MQTVPPGQHTQSTNQYNNKLVLEELEIEPKVIWKEECRICLEGNDSADQFLVNSCACAGSLQYVHESCLTSWITKQFESQQLRQQIQNGHPPICQICKHAYACQIEVQTSWATCPTIREKMKRNVLMAVATIGFTLIVMLMLVISCLYAYNDRMKPDYDISQPRFFMVYFSIILSAGSLVYGIQEFIVLFLRNQTLKVIFPHKQTDIDRQKDPQPQVFHDSQNGLVISKIKV